MSLLPLSIHLALHRRSRALPPPKSGSRLGRPGGSHDRPVPAETAEAKSLAFSHPVSLSEWRRLGKELVDVLWKYYSGLLGPPEAAPPVMSTAQPGFLRSALPPGPPEQPEPFAAVLRDFRALIMPGITHWQHPAFFSYFACNTSFVSMLADMLACGLGVLGFQWATSPACTELEQIALDWLAQLLALPPCFLSTAAASGAALYSSASEGMLVALLAAKARRMAGRPRADVLKLVVYGTDQTHSCLQKACMVAGIEHLRLLRTSPAHGYALRPAALEAAVRADLAVGLLPCFLCATIGTTSSCAVDPVADLALLAARYSLWLHIDAAWAGPFALLPEQRALHFGGLEGADSYCMNPHKALLAGWELSAMYVKDARWVKRALAPPKNPAYLETTSSRRLSASAAAALASVAANAASTVVAGEAAVPGSPGLPAQGSSSEPPEFKDLEVPLGHGRFRGLRLWMVIRLYGADGLRRLMHHRLQLQEFFTRLVSQDARFQLVPGAPPRFGLVCFRLHGSNQLNEELLDAVNNSGATMLSHTVLSGQYVIRCAIGGTHTQGRHVEAAWRTVQHCATDLLASTAAAAD